MAKFYSQIISTNNNAISNLFADTYSVYVFDSDGCQAQANIVVNEPEELAVTATGYFKAVWGFMKLTILRVVLYPTLIIGLVSQLRMKIYYLDSLRFIYLSNHRW